MTRCVNPDGIQSDARSDSAKTSEKEDSKESDFLRRAAFDHEEGGNGEGEDDDVGDDGENVGGVEEVGNVDTMAVVVVVPVEGDGSALYENDDDCAGKLEHDDGNDDETGDPEFAAKSLSW